MLLFALAFAQVPAGDLEPINREVHLVRVPGHHDQALYTSNDFSVIAEPPATGTWSWEAFGEPDIEEGDGRIWTDLDMLSTLNIDSWHQAGVRGAGVKIAVFDSGWFAGNAASNELVHASSNDCVVATHCEVQFDSNPLVFGNESGKHGFGCAETIADIAPEAELHMVRVPSVTAFENAVEWAIREDINIISMSMSYFNQSFYDGSGFFAKMMTRLAAHDILFVTSAGNNADRHWWGGWQDKDFDGNLDGQGDNRIRLYFSTGRQTAYILFNRFGDCSATDLSATLYNSDGQQVAYVNAPQNEEEGCEPLERLVADVQEGWHDLVITHESGSLTGLKVDVVLRAGAIDDSMPERSLADPAVQPDAFTVGAVRIRDYLEAPVEGFSSQGPTHSLQAKPNIAGPDGLTVATYGPAGFFGTSAATPAVAGMVALVLSSDLSRSPLEASKALQAMAWAPGQLHQDDPRWGAGKARLSLKPTSAPSCGRRPLMAGLVVPWIVFFRRTRRRETK